MRATGDGASGLLICLAFFFSRPVQWYNGVDWVDERIGLVYEVLLSGQHATSFMASPKSYK